MNASIYLPLGLTALALQGCSTPTTNHRPAVADVPPRVVPISTQSLSRSTQLDQAVRCLWDIKCSYDKGALLWTELASQHLTPCAFFKEGIFVEKNLKKFAECQANPNAPEMVFSEKELQALKDYNASKYAIWQHPFFTVASSTAPNVDTPILAYDPGGVDAVKRPKFNLEEALAKHTAKPISLSSKQAQEVNKKALDCEADENCTFAQSNELWRKLAGQPDTDCTRYLIGLGTEIDFSLARHCFSKKPISMSFETARYTQMLRRGIGGPADPYRAAAIDQQSGISHAHQVANCGCDLPTEDIIVSKALVWSFQSREQAQQNLEALWRQEPKRLFSILFSNRSTDDTKITNPKEEYRALWAQWARLGAKNNEIADTIYDWSNFRNLPNGGDPNSLKLLATQWQVLDELITSRQQTHQKLCAQSERREFLTPYCAQELPQIPYQPHFAEVHEAVANITNFWLRYHETPIIDEIKAAQYLQYYLLSYAWSHEQKLSEHWISPQVVDVPNNTQYPTK